MTLHLVFRQLNCLKKWAHFVRKTQSDCWCDTVMALTRCRPQLRELLRSGHYPCRVYCTVPGTGKHSPVRCLLFVSPAFPLTWLRLPVSLCSERETVWSFFWVWTVKQELSLLFTISLSCRTLKKNERRWRTTMLFLWTFIKAAADSCSLTL